MGSVRVGGERCWWLWPLMCGGGWDYRCYCAIVGDVGSGDHN